MNLLHRNRVRRRCRARLRAADPAGPVRPDRAVPVGEHQPGPPLHVRAIPGPASRARPCGIWIATDDDDWIFVDQQTSPLHRQHIVLHELAHMLCGHAAGDLPENDMLRRLFPDLSPAMVRPALSRTSYQSEPEREAEVLASLILTRAQPATVPIMPVTDVSADETKILRRAGLALGGIRDRQRVRGHRAVGDGLGPVPVPSAGPAPAGGLGHPGAAGRDRHARPARDRRPARRGERAAEPGRRGPARAGRRAVTLAWYCVAQVFGPARRAPAGRGGCGRPCRREPWPRWLCCSRCPRPAPARPTRPVFTDFPMQYGPIPGSSPTG